MFSLDNSLLLVIDVQGKLFHMMNEKKVLFKNIKGLIKSSYILDLPFIYTEQAPEKIGETIPEIANELMGHDPIIKYTFSCCGEPKFIETLKTMKRKQIIVCGIETHVCLYQTVHDLLNMEYEVQVVTDAVSSKTAQNKSIALERMTQMGAHLTSTEMILTELLKSGKNPKFKEILYLIK